MRCSLVSEIEVKAACNVVVEQQQGCRKRDEIQRQDEPTSPGAHSEKRKEDQDEDDRVQDVPFLAV
jgi:hypothetical protein